MFADIVVRSEPQDQPMVLTDMLTVNDDRA